MAPRAQRAANADFFTGLNAVGEPDAAMAVRAKAAADANFFTGSQHKPTQDVTEGRSPPLVVLQGKRDAVVKAVGPADVLTEVVLRGGHSLSIKASTGQSDLVTRFLELEQC